MRKNLLPSVVSKNGEQDSGTDKEQRLPQAREIEGGFKILCVEALRPLNG